MNGIFSLPSEASSGTISTDSFLSRDSWLCTSKVRMESISSPKKSRRKGYSELKENTSRILPRTANCPGSYTYSTSLKPNSRNWFSKAVTSCMSPTFSIIERSSSFVFETTNSASASGCVTMKRGVWNVECEVWREDNLLSTSVRRISLAASR